MADLLACDATRGMNGMQGRLIYLMGPSGSGKTVFLGMLVAALERVTGPGGTVVVFERTGRRQRQEGRRCEGQGATKQRCSDEQRSDAPKRCAPKRRAPNRWGARAARITLILQGVLLR